MRQLRAHGYTIYSFETGYAATELESQTRRLVGRAGPNEFETTLLNLTPLPPLLALLPELDAYEAHRRRIRFTLETLPKLALEPGPKFVFAHILAPHPPFVFDAEGGAVENRLPFQYYDGRHFIVRQSRREYLEGYAGQARFISGQILLAIDGILAASATPPIVVLQGDHGPGAGFYHEDLAASDVVERGFILNAFLLPEPAESIGLDPAITPVNTFRIILGRYLDMDLPLLPDRSFYNRESRPYAFSEITDTLARQIDARRAARGEGADGGTPDALTQ
jgi:hypothetical protein